MVCSHGAYFVQTAAIRTPELAGRLRAIAGECVLIAFVKVDISASLIPA